MATIVVAVANGAVRASISMAAHEAGHIVHAVMDSDELVLAVEQRRPSLLFLDPALARMDAVEPLKRLHWAGLLREMRVMLVDDRCAENQAWVSVARQLVEGVVDSFRKDDIRRAIDSAVGVGKMPQVPPPPKAPAPPPLPPPPPMGLKGLGPMKPLTPASRTPAAPAPKPPPAPAAPAPSAGLRPPGPGLRPVAPGGMARTPPPNIPPPAARSTRSPIPAPPPGSGAPGSPRAPTILVVEDIPSLRALLGIQLESLGWTVKWAETAEEGMKVIETEGCDVLLSDINLPGLTGDQLVLMVRKRFPGLRCLLMTSLSPERWPKVPREIPIFAKPVNMDLLVRELSATVRNTPGR